MLDHIPLFIPLSDMSSSEEPQLDSLKVPDIVTGDKNPRGIPTAVFIDDVEKFLEGSSVEIALGAFNELYGKYKYMEKNFENSKVLVKSKIPEIMQTLELLKLMKHKQSESEEMIVVSALVFNEIYFYIIICRITTFVIPFMLKRKWM